MATQLGMHAFRPLVTQRAVARPTAAFHDRFTRICIEACKQCRRAYLPELREPSTPGELAREAVSDRGTVLMAHPGGELLPPLATVNGDGVPLLTVMIGPEGGFTDAEMNEVKQAGGVIVRLGEHPLRIETAAIAALSLIMLRPMSSHVRSAWPRRFASWSPARSDCSAAGTFSHGTRLKSSMKPPRGRAPNRSASSRNVLQPKLCNSCTR
jgi:hypothetical protein